MVRAGTELNHSGTIVPYRRGQKRFLHPTLPTMSVSICRVVSTLSSAFGLLTTLGLTPVAVWSQTPGAGSQVVAMHVEARSATIDGEVRDMVMIGDSIEVTYKNTGTQSTAIVGEVQVRDGADELVTTVLLADSLVIKAGETRRFRVAMPKLDKGHYTLYAVVDFGGDALTAAQAALEIR